MGANIRLYEPPHYHYIRSIPPARGPLDSAQIMREKIDAVGKVGQEAVWWGDNSMPFYIDSLDGLAMSQDGVKLVYQSERLRNIRPGNLTPFSGFLKLTPREYEGLDDTTHSWEELRESGIERSITEDQAANHPLLIGLARGDKELATDFASVIFRYDKLGDQGFGVILGSTLEFPTLRAWTFNDYSIFQGSLTTRYPLHDAARFVLKY